MTFTRSYLLTLAGLLILGLGFLGGYLFRAFQAPAEFPLLDEAHEILLLRGLNPPPADPALEYGMIRGMLQAYQDPHTIFIEPPQAELDSQALEGKYGGIGVQMDKDSEGYWVLYPFPDSPAHQAGIQDGDRLLAVEELEIKPDTESGDIQAAVRGPVGQKVNLTIGRAPDYTPLELSIKRQEIALPSVTWRLDSTEPRLGIIKVNLMTASTADEIVKSVDDLKSRGATHFALDLRDNPGGLVDAGVDIARLFLKDGVVIQQQYRDQPAESIEVKEPGPLSELPLVVLINGGSASASEIAAGALKARQRAQVIGSPSYGKDTIQLVFELSDKSSLHVTAAHWWVPGLEPTIYGNGVQPDILVDPSTPTNGADPVILAAIQALFGAP